MTGTFAIVGSGPSGFYAAEALARKAKGCHIDIFDRLPTPYGLVRGGVAPDHQGTKNIVRVFERLMAKGQVRFLGHVTIGRDLSLDELRAHYDGVIVATGAPLDRHLAIPGADLPGVHGSAAFVGWYNGHPDHVDLNPDLSGRNVVIIGNGNVAIDIARVLTKTPAEMARGDLADHAARAIHQAAFETVTIAGRRGPVEASFTDAELAELGELERVTPRVDPTVIPETIGSGWDPATAKVKERNLEILRGFAQRSDTRPVTLNFAFNCAPVRFVGDERVSAVRFARTRVEDGRAVATGTEFEMPADLVVTAIGYRNPGLAGLPMDETRGVVVHDQGRVDAGLYVVGWAKRGPSGVIATNRADSMAVVDRLLAEVTPGAKDGGGGIDTVLAERGVPVVTFDQWQRIDAAERAAAAGDAPRRKLVRLEDMLAAAQED